MIKKHLIFLLFIFTIFCNLNVNVVYAKTNIDENINGILNGIDNQLYNDINEELNGFFNDNLTFKERIVKFITGEANITFETLALYLKNKIFNFFDRYKKIIIYILFISISSSVLNVIIPKNDDNTIKYTIFYICYSLVVIVVLTLIYELFKVANTTLNKLNKMTELVFPLMFSISTLTGNLGVNLFKPLTCFAGFLSSSITTNYLIPLLSFSSVTLIVSNLSDTIKLKSLSSTIFSILKWTLGLIGIIYTFILAVQGIVNSQYNGISVKILKYTTGSMIPIIGGFLSGGMDVLLSSAILIKNSIGLLGVFYILITIGGSAISLLVLSFIIKFLTSISEPILDKKFFNVIMGISTVINYLTSIIFLCAYIYFITVIGFIFSTILILWKSIFHQ